MQLDAFESLAVAEDVAFELRRRSNGRRYECLTCGEGTFAEGCLRGADCDGSEGRGGESAVVDDEAFLSGEHNVGDAASGEAQCGHSGGGVGFAAFQGFAPISHNDGIAEVEACERGHFVGDEEEVGSVDGAFDGELCGLFGIGADECGDGAGS